MKGQTIGEKLILLGTEKSKDESVNKIGNLFSEVINILDNEFSKSEVNDINDLLYNQTLSQIITAKLWAIKLININKKND